MKINNLPGEFGFKALFPQNTYEQTSEGEVILTPEYKLSVGYYFSLEEAKAVHGEKVKWPVEVWDNESVYVPDQSEL